MLQTEVLGSLPGLLRVQQRNGSILLSVERLSAALPALIAVTERLGTQLINLSTRQPSLDDVFLAVTGRSLRDQNSA